MKLTVYRCDNCDNVLSDRKVNSGHWSICFDGNSGFYLKQDSGKYRNIKWKQNIKITGIKHFCNSACISDFFRKLHKQHELEEDLKHCKHSELEMCNEDCKTWGKNYD